MWHIGHLVSHGSPKWYFRKYLLKNKYFAIFKNYILKMFNNKSSMATINDQMMTTCPFGKASSLLTSMKGAVRNLGVTWWSYVIQIDVSFDHTTFYDPWKLKYYLYENNGFFFCGHFRSGSQQNVSWCAQSNVNLHNLVYRNNYLYIDAVLYPR